MSKSSQLDAPSVPSKPRPQRSPSQLFASTPLFQGFASQNVSRNDLNSPHTDSPDPQRLPRPQAAPSLAGLSVRPSITQTTITDDRQPPQKTLAQFQPTTEKQDDFHPEALWEEMQRTLADVELSALNSNSSSHIFGAAHSRALEELRAAQLALAQAWARSEADDIGGNETDDSIGSGSDSATVRKADGLTSSPSKNKATGASSTKSPTSRRRKSSTASNGTAAEDLEAETERDIQLARKRRAANDRYFQQVNKGVLNVVAKLDDVASAMKQVERESREVWDDGSVISTDMDESGRHESTGNKGNMLERGEDLDLDHMLTRTTTTGTGMMSNTDTDALSDSPVTPKRHNVQQKKK